MFQTQNPQKRKAKNFVDLTNEISKSFNTIIQIIRNDLLTLRIKFRSYPGAIFGSFLKL